MTGVDVEHTKALTDAEIDADLVGDGGMYFEPDAGYPEYGNDTVRWAYRLGHEAGGAAVPALVAAVERVQAQVDKALEILDNYNHSDDGDLPECALEDRWRLYRDLLATLNPEALETKP